MKRVFMIAAMVLAVASVAGAKGCGPQGGSATPNPSFSGFSEPRGAAAPPPVNGGGVDPLDDDFSKPASPPAGAPEGTITYEVRAQMYNAQLEPIGGLSTAYITATTSDPRALSGVGPGGVGAFPYDKESVRLPFQLPIFIQPGIVVSVGATFNAFADAGEILACWFTAPVTGVISGTRNQLQASGRNTLLSVDCFGNIGT